MDICTCVVAIGGDPRAVVPKHSVTPAELVLLQQAHGDDAVTKILIAANETRTDDDERERLALRYGDEKVIQAFGQYGDLPQTCKAARIAENLMEEAAPAGEPVEEDEDE